MFFHKKVSETSLTLREVNSVLQANDKEFKTELGRIAEMTVWDDAKEEASEQLKEANIRQLQLDQQFLVRSQYVTELKTKVGGREADNADCNK